MAEYSGTGGEGGGSMSSGGGGLLSSAGEWLAKPNNQKLLAGLGGAVAAPYAKSNPGLLAGSQLATGLIESKAAQNAAGKVEQNAANWRNDVNAAGIAEKKNAEYRKHVIDTLGGMTHPTLQGVTGAKVKPDGSLALELTTPGNPETNAAGWEAKPEGGYPSSTGENPAFPLGESPRTTQIETPTSTTTEGRSSRLLPFLLGPSGLSSEDLGGLTPEQVHNAVMQSHQSQQLAGQRVDSLMKRLEYQEAAPSRELENEYNRTRIATAKAALPYVGPKADSEIAHNRALTESLLAGIPIDKAYKIAQTKKLEQELQDQKDLGDLPKQILQAKLDQANREGSTYVSFDLGGGKKIVTTSDKVMDLIEAKEGGVRGQLTEQNKITNARNERLDAQKREDAKNEAEGVILGRATAKEGGKLNAEDPRIQEYANQFNANADTPYAYVWRGTPHDKKAHKIYLPRHNINGSDVQLTARMIHQGALATGLSDADYIELLADKRGVKFPEKFPWRQ